MPYSSRTNLNRETNGRKKTPLVVLEALSKILDKAPQAQTPATQSYSASPASLSPKMEAPENFNRGDGSDLAGSIPSTAERNDDRKSSDFK